MNSTASKYCFILRTSVVFFCIPSMTNRICSLTIQKAKFVLAKLKKKNVSVIKRSELFQMCRGKFFKKTEEIFPTLELLEGHGYIRLEEPERQSVGRPADVKIIVNPAA